MRRLFIFPLATFKNTLKFYVIIGLLLITNFLFSQSDNCATATVITLDPAGNACVNGTTTNATSSNIFHGGCNTNPVNEVWYTYVTNGAVNDFVITPTGMSNPEIIIYSGGCDVQLETCNTVAGTGVLSTNWGFPVGTQVWIGVMSNEGNEGGFQLCVNSTAPLPTGGNTCATAINLCNKNATTQIDMSTITPSGIEPQDCFLSSVQSDVYFTFTVTQTGTLEFQALPTGNGAANVELDWVLYDLTTLGGCPVNNSPSVACNYNFNNSSGSPSGMGPVSCTTCPTSGGDGPCGEFCAPVTITAGNTYMIIMDYFTGGGTGTMDFSFLPGMTAEISPIANFTVTPTAPVCGGSLTAVITDNSLSGPPTWDFGDGSPTFTGSNPPDHTYNTPGTYAITASIGGSCPSTHTEFVQLFEPVSTTATTVIEACAGSCDGSISLATTGGSGNYSYSWTPGGQTTPIINGLCANNYSVTITDVICGNLTQAVTLPTGVPCQNCNIDSLSASISACQANNTYTANGTIDFTTSITTDSLIITINDGINTYDTIIYPPFVSPTNWSISGMNSNGNNITITATFAANPSCTSSLNSTAPAACGCVAQIGNFNITMTGNGTTNYTLCFGDQIDITSNVGYNPPAEANNPPSPNGYNPGIGYLIYSCPPTIGTIPSNVPPHDDITNDPCFVGVVGFGNSFSDINTNGQPSWIGPWTNNTLYYVPITFYDTLNNPPTYSYVNTSIPCYEMGNPIAVQYLPQIVSSNPTEDCLDSSFTITITGGLPAINGSSFTASNLSPTSASFINTTTTNGGTIQINGLLNGDMYSFDVVDDNGCPITISGGPFVGLPNANAGVDDTSCVLTYTLNAIPSIGTGSWSGSAGVIFNPVNSPTATVTVPATGTYNFTWTETNTATCVTSDVVTITFSNLSESTVASPATCSANDGTITISAIDGVSPYQYSIDGGATFQAANTFSNLAANTYNIVVKDAIGCEVTASYTINSIAGPTINSSNFTDPTCNEDCDGTITVTGTSPAGGEQYSIDGINFQATGVFNNLCAGTYTIIISDANACTDTVSLTLIDPDSVTISASNVTICTGQSATLTATAGGGSGSGYAYNWNNGASTTSTYTVSPPTTTSYPIFATDGNSCTSPTINVTVTVTPPLSVVASPSDTNICLGESVTIYATPFFGNGGPYTYQWSNGSTNSSQVVSPATTTIYTVTLNDGCSPPTTGTVTINIMPLPQVSFTADKFEACETPVETFTFYNTTDTTGGMVGTSIWDFGDGSSAVGDTVTHAYNGVGTYNVTLTITSSTAAGGCTNSVTYPNYITIHQNPTADFFMKDNPADMLNPTVSFYDQSYFNIVGWTWDIGGLDSSYLQNPTYEFPVDTGHYPIILIVIDDNGCIGTITKILEIEGEFGIYIPNAFTPDFDFLNEGFSPKGFGISELNYSFYIFDRWGEMIFKSHTLFEPWNGSYKGKLVQNGVYVWKLDFQDLNGKRHSKIGHVSVIR